MQNSNPPVVLCFSALDPSGGGGLQADIESVASMGCHCAPVATSLCATATADNAEAFAVETTLVIEQARSILEDMPVKAVKVGFCGSVANVEAIHSILQDYPHLPLIIHPAFCLWDRDSSEQADLPAALAALLLPLSEVAVISLSEAHILAKEADTIDATAQAITSKGCRNLLLTQSLAKENRATTSLYDLTGLIKHYEWEQTPPTCHGATSTLTAAIAALRPRLLRPCAGRDRADQSGGEKRGTEHHVDLHSRSLLGPPAPAIRHRLDACSMGTIIARPA